MDRRLSGGVPHPGCRRWPATRIHPGGPDPAGPARLLRATPTGGATTSSSPAARPRARRRRRRPVARRGGDPPRIARLIVYDRLRSAPEPGHRRRPASPTTARRTTIGCCSRARSPTERQPQRVHLLAARAAARAARHGQDSPGEGDQRGPASAWSTTSWRSPSSGPASHGQPIFVAYDRQRPSRHRTGCPAAGARRDDRTRSEYSDGFGRLLQTRAQAEDVLFGDERFGGGDAVCRPQQSDGAGADAGRPRQRAGAPPERRRQRLAGLRQQGRGSSRSTSRSSPTAGTTRRPGDGAARPEGARCSTTRAAASSGP